MNQIQNIKVYLYMLIVDCIIMVFYIYAFIFKKTYRILTGLCIIQQIFLYYVGQFDMGVFNMLGMVKALHYPILFILLFFLFLIIIIKFFCKKSIILTICGLIAIALVIYFTSDQCSTWKEGINGEI